jgi:nonribosomal peptide synthetase MxcG
LTRRAVGGRLPLPIAAQGIWVGQALDPDNTAYWTAEIVALGGPLDEAGFLRAVEGAVLETEALHQRFRWDGECVWREPVAEPRCPIARLDFSEEVDPAGAAQAFIDGDLRGRVDLENGPLFATALIRLGPERHEWYLRVHHIAFDGYAYHLLRRRVAAWFEAGQRGEAPPPSAAVPLVALVDEVAAYRSSPAFDLDRAFLRARLSPMEGSAPRLSRGRLCAGGLCSPHTLGRIQAAAATARLDWTSWLLAATAAFLVERDGARSAVLGLPVAGRLGSVGAATPCMMMNIVPLCVPAPTGARFGDFARRLATELRELRLRQRYRYEDLKHDLGVRSTGARLFGTVVNLLPFDGPVAFGSATARVRSVARGPVEDLALTLVPEAGSLAFDFEANPNARGEDEVRALAECLPRAIDALLEDPNARLSVPAGLEAALTRGVGPSGSCETVLERIRRAARAFPERVAIEQDGRTALSYSALLRSVRGLAAELREQGVGAGSRVALLLPRSPEAIVAQLAVAWAGGAYVPLDPDSPPERIQMVLDDIQAALVVCSSEHARLAGSRPRLTFEEQHASQTFTSALEEPSPVPENALAYVIYTSGSTGRPNGVSIERSALSNFVAAATERYAIGDRDRILQFAPLQFDASVEEVLLALTNGATLVLRTQPMLESLSGFLEACERLRISVLDLPTAFFHELVPLLAGPSRLPASVRLVIIGGEAAAFDRVRAFRGAVEPDVVLLNTYGPTETTVVATVAELVGPSAVDLDDGPVPIGRPLAGYAVLVLDERRRPVANGEAGELCVLGASLARGYFNQPELTARRFVELDGDRGKLRGYLTGDRVRLRADGQLVYLGRIDDELKISGHRVNPLEIEAALLEQVSVREAAVVACDRGLGKTLEACVVPRAGELDECALRAALARRFSPQAIPRRFLALARLPRDANGKLDRPQLRRLATEQVAAAPRSATTTPERRVLCLFAEVLGTSVSDPAADFFALGGHSLLALSLGQRLSREFGRDVPLSLVFQRRTASALARALTVPEGWSADRADDPLAARIVLQEGAGPPLFCVHPADGLSWCYFGLVAHLPGVPLEALQAPGLTGELPGSFDDVVARYLCTITSRQPRGPYRLLGWSSGGGIAHALASALVARGETVSVLALLDAYPADIWHGTPEPTEEDALVSMLDAVDASPFRADGTRYTKRELIEQLRLPSSSLSGFDDATLERMIAVALHSMRSYRTAAHPIYPGDVLFFRAEQRQATAPDPRLWLRYVSGRFEEVPIDATHLAMCQQRSLAAIAATLAPRLR